MLAPAQVADANTVGRLWSPLITGSMDGHKTSNTTRREVSPNHLVASWSSRRSQPAAVVCCTLAMNWSHLGASHDAVSWYLTPRAIVAD